MEKFENIQDGSNPFLTDDVINGRKADFLQLVEEISGKEDSVRSHPYPVLVNILRIPYFVNEDGKFEHDFVKFLWKDIVVEDASEFENEIASKSAQPIDYGYRWNLVSEDLEEGAVLENIDANDLEKPIVLAYTRLISEINISNYNIINKISECMDETVVDGKKIFELKDLEPKEFYALISDMVDRDIQNVIGMKERIILSFREILSLDQYKDISGEDFMNTILAPAIEKTEKYVASCCLV